MDLRKKSVSDTAFLHLRDADDELMYEDGPDGQPDKSKPVGITLHGPGSKKFAKAAAAKNNRNIDRLKSRASRT